MRRLFVLILLLITLPLSGENRWESHGHNYSYSSFSSPDEVNTIFPVAWDIRSASDLVLVWQRIFGISDGNPIHSILEESIECGFNTVLVRAELTDKWFPDQPGAYGDNFFPFAGEIRDMGLHVVVGGFRTSLDQSEHNQSVIDYLKLYIPLTAGNYSGDIIGMFSFDEPDVKYLENPDLSDQWLEFVSYWNGVCRNELNLQVLCYFAKYGDRGPDGQVAYYTDTTSVLNRMARFTDMVGIDMYPVKNNFRRTDLLHTSQGKPYFITATDIIQTYPIQIQSLNSRDELVSIFPSGDSSLIKIESIHWDGIDLNLQTSWTAPLSFMPDGIAASDFRAGYAIQEAPGYVNSGMVLWQDSQPVDEAIVLVSNGSTPAFCQLPDFPGSDKMTPAFFCVGQTDFWSDVLQIDGIIGRGRLAILAGMEDESGTYYLMLFTASIEGSTSIEAVFTSPVKLNFRPTSAVWGTFWGTWYEAGTIQTAARNGFVILDENGSYNSLNQLSREYWKLYPAHGAAQYHDLFGPSVTPDITRICRIDGNYPPFFAGHDQLAGWFADRSQIVIVSSNNPGGSMGEPDIISIMGLPGRVTGFDLIRNDHRYSDRPLFTVEGGDVYIGIESIETGISNGTINVKLENYCQGDTVITGVRAMHTRDAIRSVLLPSEDGYYIPQCEIYSDKVDQWRFQWYPEAHQVGMNLGVQQTARDNALFAVVQSYGRHGFALPTFCASPDTMLYLVTAPLVAGARGLVFYALDIAMMSGNGGDDGFARAPFLLQNWGPSRDTENVDMVGRVHGAVTSLTGNGNGGVDYLSPLVDTTWTVLDDDAVFNSTDADTLLNFIALENAACDTILVIAVNESTSSFPTSFDPVIVFQNLPSNFRIVSSEGFIPELINPVSGFMMELDYSAMPGVSASLVTISMNTGEQSGQEWLLSTATRHDGTTSVSFLVPGQEAGELALYDLSGRKIMTLWESTGNGLPINTYVEKNDLPSGLYFLTLTGEQTTLTGKCFLW
ncbi:MAG: T9SS type A sorting domain-containing protein [Candidatus Sabulitectum sp.]|nr:T9SS type A sorting domain-containing protein [Candidatus Sabulitectum sp.]